MLPADMSRSPLDQLSTFVERVSTMCLSTLDRHVDRVSTTLDRYVGRVSIAGNDRHSTAGAFNTHDPNYFGF